MARKSALALCLAWLMLPATALGLGLGDIHTESALNEPFEARVILHSDRPAELRDLDVRLASREAYERAGIARSDALLNLRFEVRDDVQPPYIAISSRQPIREPFLSLLLEIGHPRGRLQREYTVLLDPPTMMPSERREARAPVSEQPAPREAEPERAERAPEPRERWTPPPPPEVAETEREAPPERRVEEAPRERAEPAPRPRPEPRAEPAAPDLPEEYTVRRGDTLWELADRFAADEVATHQMMLAIFERNPEAFRDNINLMHEGAVLRVPSRSQASAYSLAEAGARIERDRLAQRGEEPEAPAEVAETEEPRLELVAPGEADDDAEPEAVAPGVAEDIAAMSEAELREALAAERVRVEREREQREALESEVGTLREEVEALEQLIALGVDDIAAFEARLAEIQGEQEAIAAMTFVADPAEELAVEMTALLERLAEEAALAEAAADEEEAVAEDEDEVEAVAAVDEPAAPVTTADDPAGGFMDDVTAALSNPTVLAGLLGTAALLGLLAFRRRRQSEEATALEDDDHEPVEVAPSTNEEEDALFEDEPRADDEMSDSDEMDDSGDDDSALGSEDESEVDEDPFAGDDEDGFDLPGDEDSDKDDPASEADFHLSYGMYDEALEAIDRGLADAPDDEELKAKRLEILSAAGKQDEFLEGARDFADTHGKQSSQWASIANMGRELAPGEALFSEDDDSDDSDELLDFGDDSDSSADNDKAGEVDLSAEADDDESKADDQDDDGDMDFDLGDFDTDSSDKDTDKDKSDEKSAADDDDGLAFDLDMDDDKDEEKREATSSAADDDDYNLDVDDSGSDDDLSFDMDDSGSDEKAGEASDDEAYSLDDEADAGGDLDFDIDESKSGADDAFSDVDAGEEIPDLPGDDDLEEYDEIQTRIDLARAYIGMDDAEGAQSVLEEVLQEGEERHKKQARELLAEITGEAPDEKAGGNGSAGGDVDVSGEEPLGEGDDIGTQLDLARAYVDMGDEDGASKLIEQVLSEGTDEQKSEAQALKDKLSS